PTDRTRRELAALGKPVGVHLAEQATAAVTGLLLPPLLATLLAAGGVPLGFAVPGVAALVFAALGFVAPELAVRSEAAAHRAAFRHALGSFLSLTVTALAGGAGVDQALDDAASVGRGPADADAAAATERMSLPIVALMAGFLIFLAFPAVAAVMSGL